MKNIILSLRKLSPFILFIILSFSISIVYWSCKPESIATPKDDTSIVMRGGPDAGGGLDSEDLLELLGNSCAPDSICDTLPIIDSVSITLPNYTGCSFQVIYEYTYCDTGTNPIIYISDFQILSHNCSAFTTALVNAYTAGGMTLTNFLETTDAAIATQIQSNLINQFVPVNSYPCDNSKFLVIEYIRVSCYKYCIISHPNQTESYTKIACGSDCCVKRTTACRDSNGQLVIQSSYDPPSSPVCQDPPLFEDNPIPRLCHRETPCAYWCPGE